MFNPNKVLSCFRLFPKHHGSFAADYTEFNLCKLNDSHWPLMQILQLLSGLRNILVWIKCKIEQKMGLCQFTIHDWTMHISCIDYANMLILYRDNSWYYRKEKTSLTKQVGLFQQIVLVIVQLNPNEHDFQKQCITNVLQNRCF